MTLLGHRRYFINLYLLGKTPYFLCLCPHKSAVGTFRPMLVLMEQNWFLLTRHHRMCVSPAPFIARVYQLSNCNWDSCIGNAPIIASAWGTGKTSSVTPAPLINPLGSEPIATNCQQQRPPRLSFIGWVRSKEVSNAVCWPAPMILNPYVRTYKFWASYSM